MDSYYAITGPIRYYGQLPRSVKREWEIAYDAAGRRVRREFVVGEMDFQEEGFSLVEMDGAPYGFSADVIATPSEEPMDLSRRREPVHEVLANLMLDAGSLYAFTKRWGFLEGYVDAKKGRFRTRAEHIQPRQDLLRKGWRSEGGAIQEMAEDIKARVDVKPTGVEIAVLDLWNLIRLLFLRDHSAGRTKVCANKDCLSPYFLEQRKGQKFCSHKCAVLLNVRRFRERAAEHESQRQGRAKQ